MSDGIPVSELSRSDFLKIAGLSALLPLLGGVTQVSAAEGKADVIWL
jgi:hypothetical protein